MRGIAVQWSPEQIAVRVYTDGKSTAEAQDEFDAAVMTQLTADFATPERGGPTLGFEFVECRAPAPLPDWGCLAYARAERE